MDLLAHESLSIKATRLNAFTLKVLSAVNVSWTLDVSRHMLLTKAGGQYNLEIFSIPCAFKVTMAASVGIPLELASEVKQSYALLFNAWASNSWHSRFTIFWGLHKICWCWSCSARRYRRECLTTSQTPASIRSNRRLISRTARSAEEIYEPLLVELFHNVPDADSEWTLDEFPRLWTRIMRLDQHLHTTRPWSLWVLFRDRRDTMQFWTFL